MSHMLRLKYIVPQHLDGTQIRRKAIFEGVQFKDGKPVRRAEGGFEPELAADGKPIIASLLLGNWNDGTGLLEVLVRRGNKTKVIENFILSKANDFAKSTLPDGTESTVARIANGYHTYVQCEVERRMKDGKPVVGADGREVLNVVDPEWVLFQSASGTFAVPASKEAQSTLDLESAVAAA
jgi:hypothetical protein